MGQLTDFLFYWFLLQNWWGWKQTLWCLSSPWFLWGQQSGWQFPHHCRKVRTVRIIMWYTFIVGSKIKAKKFPIILLCTCRIPKSVTKNFIKNHYSHLSPCGHPTIADTPIKRTVAKPLAKTNYKRLTEINSHYYGLLLKRTWIRSP